ncbi:MAG: hypothetical protein K2Q25_11650 [Mycobacteriaceae bacterium]|nr:hypothetical protein [Mycobacteriaceae bacterium]
MRVRPPILLTAVIAVIVVSMAGYQAKVYGAPQGVPAKPRTTLISPLVQAIAPPELAQPSATFDGLQERVHQATDEANAHGATLSIAVLDRVTRHLVSNGNTSPIATASVAKLFIADNLLLQETQQKITLSPEDHQALDSMLQSSNDDAAERFWNQGNGNAIITEVAHRYGLVSTAPPPDGHWWNTISSAADLIRYYDLLLDGSGGLPPDRSKVIVDDLAAFTPTGIDGYPQRFGVPEGLWNEPVAVKQGWMCCIGENWLHLSTGLVGADHRYIVVIASSQPTDDATARQTLTEAVKHIFPAGRI